MPISRRHLLHRQSSHVTAETGPITYSLQTTCDSTISTTEEAPRSKKQQETAKSVSFSTVSVRSYTTVMGDHPFCDRGCALTLGWKYTACPSQSIDAFEDSRATLRKDMRSLRTTWDERHQRLMDSNEYSESEIRHANRLQYRHKNQRRRRAEESMFFQEAQTPGRLVV